MLSVFLWLIFGDHHKLSRANKLLLAENREHNLIVVYLSSGLIASSLMFIVYLLGGVSDQYFRHYGFLMGIVTILGSLSLGNLLQYYDRRSHRSSYLAMVIVIVFLLVTVPIIFPSPYIHQDSDHLSEQEMNGYETALEIGDDNMQYATLRRGIDRYVQATMGRVGNPNPSELDADSPPDHFIVSDVEMNNQGSQDRGISEYYNGNTYLVVSERDRVLETETYNGLRFNSGDFDYLNEDPSINSVHSNGEFNMYHIN
jgi:hypothetical protein